MKNLIISMGVLFSLLSSTSVIAIDIAFDEEFPGRADYPDVPIYLKARLFKDLNNVVVIDARSTLEYETLRVKGALNIPVASKQFVQMVKKLRSKNKKRIVFYCNGRTCHKSYLATKTALAAGIKDVFAYDAGIFEWATTYPKHAVLLGESPMDPKKIIPKKLFKTRFLSPLKFTEAARGAPRGEVLVLDVRDKYQRGAVGFFLGLEKWTSLDDRKKLQKYLDIAVKENLTLYIYDETGKQVRWLQYTLEQSNVKNYFFMSKGAKGFYKDMIM